MDFPGSAMALLQVDRVPNGCSTNSTSNSDLSSLFYIVLLRTDSSTITVELNSNDLDCNSSESGADGSSH